MTRSTLPAPLEPFNPTGWDILPGLCFAPSRKLRRQAQRVALDEIAHRGGPVPRWLFVSLSLELNVRSQA